MAEQKELFNVLDDGSGDGESLSEVTTGAPATSARGILAFPGWNQSGEAAQWEFQDEGTAALTQNTSIMPCKDDSGNTQYIPMEGNAVRVTSEGSKTPYSGEAQITVASSGSEELVLEVTIGAVTSTYDEVELQASSFKDCTWRAYHVDDVGGTETETIIFRARSGAGQYNALINISCLNLDTTGGTGTQAIRVKVEQRSGTGSDASAFLCIKENN